MRALLALFVAGAAAVSVDELSKWFESAEGFNYMSSDAQKLAQQEAPILTQCDVSVEDLASLKKVLYSTSSLDLSMDWCKNNLLSLAKQHVDPKELGKMYAVLYSTRGVDLPKSEAQSRSIEMVKAYAEADQVQALFDFLYSMRGANLFKSEAQAKTLELGKAGCDPVALTNSFAAAQGTKEQRLQQATSSAIRANLNGEVKKYAKDGQIYTAKEFQDYYQDSYMKEWANGVPEKKMAEDWKAYTASQYRIEYQKYWENYWHKASTATQRRLAEDGKVYTVPEFVQFYKDDWQTKWRAAPELPCQECHTGGAALVV